jgi:hypothetical protein
MVTHGLRHLEEEDLKAGLKASNLWLAQPAEHQHCPASIAWLV